MSSVSSISGSSSNSYLWILPLREQQSTQAATASSVNSTSTSSSDSTSGDSQNPLEDLLKQVQAAIVAALQNADQTSGTPDYRKIIQDAIEQTLKSNGIDGTQGQDQQAAGMNRMPPAGPPPGPPPDAAAGSTDTSTSSTTDGTSTSTTQSSDSLAQILQNLLKGLGGDSQDGTVYVGFLFDLQA